MGHTDRYVVASILRQHVYRGTVGNLDDGNVREVCSCIWSGLSHVDHLASVLCALQDVELQVKR